MMRVGDADLRIAAAAQLATDHERDHARQVALEREDLEVEHQLRVFFESRRDTGGLIDDRQLVCVLLLRLLNASLHVAYCFEVLIQLGAIVRSEIALEPGDLFSDGIQDALVSLNARHAGSGIRAATVPKQALEYRTRIVLHGKRRRRRSP